MFETCPGILESCHHPREYKSFVEEFLIDIRATVAAMEAVCPVAKHKSLKDCPVLRDNEIPAMDVFPLVKDILEEETKLVDISGNDNTDFKVKTNTAEASQKPLTIDRARESNLYKSKDVIWNTSINNQLSLENKAKKQTNQTGDVGESILHLRSNSIQMSSTPLLKSEYRKKSQESFLSSNITTEINQISMLNYTTNSFYNNETEPLDLDGDAGLLEGDRVFKSCQDSDVSCIVAKVLLIGAVITLVLLAIVFYWECSQSVPKNYPVHSHFI